MKPIYFDVTDFVAYAMGNLRVSGIQRVQLKIIYCIARSHKNYPIYCTFLHPVMKKMVMFKPLDVFYEQEFDPQLLLGSLGLLNTKLIFKRSMRFHLDSYSNNKLLRALKKLQIYFYAFFLRSRLVDIGVSDGLHLGRRFKKIEIKKAEIEKDAIYVVLGTSWAIKGVIDFCRAHSSCGGDVVQMVYDLIPYVRPQYFKDGLRSDFNNWLRDLAGYVDRYICISEYTAKDLRDFLSADASKKSIKAVPLAHEFDGFARNSSDAQIDPSIEHVVRSPFVLCVGTVEVRKNGVALLRVWSRLIEKIGAKMPRLIFAGKRGWLIHEFEALLKSSPRLSQYVEMIESPSDEGLAALYQHAIFTVYPSFYEGWGLPVGEAAWFGKTCLTSNTTSMPEVCGSLVEYCDPVDIDDMTQKIEFLILNPEEVKNKEALIRTANLRTWSDVGNEIFDFLLSQQSAPAQVGCSLGSAGLGLILPPKNVSVN